MNHHVYVPAVSATMAMLLLWPQVAGAQLNIQSNPVFSTPTPATQEIGPPPAPFKATITMEKDAAEFTIGAVSFDGNMFHNRWTVRRALKPLYRQQGKKLTRADLEAVLQKINQANKFKVNAKLTENTTTGDVDIHLDILEQQPFQITGTFDNQGRPGIGMYRGGVQLTDDSLFGFGDKLSLQYLGADGTQRIVGNYTFPLNRRGGTLDLTYIFQDLDYDRDLTLASLPQVGQDHAWIATLAQPIDPKKIWTVYTSMLFRHATIVRNNVEIVRADPRPWTVGVKFNKPDKWGSTLIDASSIQNFRWFGTDTLFWRTKVDIKRVFKLPHQHKLVFRASGQYTPDALPPVQQFLVGGAYTVRGYTEGLLTADRGHFYSLEHFMPIPFLNRLCPWLSDRTQWVSFVDVGQSWLDKSNARYVNGISGKFNRTTLLDAGVGLRYRLSPALQGFVDAGWGLYNRNVIELGGQPSFRVHFGVRTDLLPKVYRKRRKTPV